MSSASLWKISNKSPNVNWFKLRSKVSVANLNLLRFGTFGHLPLISVYDTLANYPKLRFRALGCLGRISFYYTLAIQELTFVLLKSGFILQAFSATFCAKHCVDPEGKRRKCLYQLSHSCAAQK